MKQLIASLAFLFLLGTLSAQVIYHRTKNPNVGFGKATDCTQSLYMNFCVNGPLVSPNKLPVGGYVDNGTQMKNWVNPEDSGGNFAVDNAIFGLGFDGNLYMVSSNQKEMVPQMKWAFQNGPILVKDSLNMRGTSQSKTARSGIGYKKDGTIVVIVSISPITFYEFANLFVQEGCSNALYLDGGPYVGCSNKDTTYGTMVSQATKLQFFNN